MASYGGTNGPPPTRPRNTPTARLDVPAAGDHDDELPVARSVDHLLIRNRSLGNMQRSDSCSRSECDGRFLFTGRSRGTSIASGNSEFAPVVNPEVYRHENMAIRYRLFNRLDPGGQTLLMPDHVCLPSELFSILPFDDFKDSDGKQGSIVTIFSIWNTMMGTSLLAMPWALQQAGLGLGVFLILFMGSVALFTAYRVIESPKNLAMDVDAASAEFSDVCRYFFGRRGEYTAVFFSIIVLFGGVIVYFVLMSNFLYYTGNIVYESLQPNSTTIPVLANKTFTCDIYYDPACAVPKDDELYSYFTEELDADPSYDFFSYKNLWRLQGSVPFLLAFFTFPLFNMKSPTFFTKFNVLGTISVLYLICFTISKACECGFNVNFVNPHSINYVKLFNWNFPALTGTLALSFFIHNAVLTILRNQKHPENNARDLTIGFVLSAVCYLLIGVLFFLAFPGRRECIADNFLNNFGSGDVMSATARLFLLFQMITVLPLLMYLIRVQFSYVFTGTVYPGFGYVCLINVGVVSVAVFFAVIYPHVGSILRYVGSVSGLVYVFALPVIIHLSKLRQEGRMTRTQVAIHSAVVLLGVLNLISQFLV
ncbi:putative sodium-coupled neutral amino acid transporter 9 [Aphelenchoides fujianensis]|nr:putative sodium-coupled neutral amino acid transporter 9 [Aphelenchoides fujianensis]